LLDRAVAMLQDERDLAIKLAGHLATAKILSGHQVGAFLDAGLSGNERRASIQESRDAPRVPPSI